MLAYVTSGPSWSNSTLVYGTVAPGDQDCDVWHAVAHGCVPAQHQPGINSGPMPPETLMMTWRLTGSSSSFMLMCSGTFFRSATLPASWTCEARVLMLCVVGPPSPSSEGHAIATRDKHSDIATGYGKLPTNTHKKHGHVVHTQFPASACLPPAHQENL